MTVYPYEPPERMYQDTILAFKDFQMASTWSVRVEPDPLGPVNKIVTLMRGQYRVKSVLAPVPAEAVVKAGYDGGTGWSMFGGLGWRALSGLGEDPEPEPYRPPLWFVEVDDRRVLEVPEHETWPPTPPSPPVPLWRRFRHWTTRHARTAADGLAGRLGYHTNDNCGEWDE